MKSPLGNLFFYLFLFLFCINSLNSYSQKIKEHELDGHMIYTDLDGGGELTFGLAAKGNYWLNPYVALTAGVMMNYSKIDLGFYSPANNRVFYDLDEPIFNLNGILGLKLSSPTYKRFGLMSSANFMFAPIPFNLVGANRETYEPDSYHPKEKSKSYLVYTRFSPSYSIEFSLFYEKKKETGRVRLSLGGGITNYNPYNAYYYAKIDGLRLRDHVRLRPDDISFVLFVRLSGFGH